MYEEHFNLREKPFSLLPDSDYLYLSEKHRTALAVLEYGLNDRAGFTVVSGKIGSGKTTLIKHVLAGLEAEVTVGVMNITLESIDDVLQWVLLAFSIESPRQEKAERFQLFRQFVANEYAAGRRTILIIDEAQNLSRSTLEELRMLSNINAGKDHLLQLILLGQPELIDTLRLPEMVQFAQRVSVDYFIEGLSEKETRQYIRHRLAHAGGKPSIFRSDSFPLIFKHSNGLPRIINLICDTALVYAFGNQRKTVNAELIDRVVNEKTGPHRIWSTDL